MSNNALMAVDSTIIEIYEESFPSSFNLRSKIFIKLHRIKGGYCEIK
jgi:hypothetical protein